jgi:hypothetical protein
MLTKHQAGVPFQQRSYTEGIGILRLPMRSRKRLQSFTQDDTEVPCEESLSFVRFPSRCYIDDPFASD